MITWGVPMGPSSTAFATAGMPVQQVQRNGAPHPVADDVRLLNLPRVQERHRLRNPRVHPRADSVAGGLRVMAFAETNQVGCEAIEPVAQRGQGMLPVGKGGRARAGAVPEPNPPPSGPFPVSLSNVGWPPRSTVLFWISIMTMGRGIQALAEPCRAGRNWERIYRRSPGSPAPRDLPRAVRERETRGRPRR